MLNLDQQTLTINNKEYNIRFNENSFSPLENSVGAYCGTYCVVGYEEEQISTSCIIVEPGGNTPIQRVLEDTKIIEAPLNLPGTAGLLAIKGSKSVTFDDLYQVDGDNPNVKPFDVNIRKGDIFTWIASKDKYLFFSEVCIPQFSSNLLSTISDPITIATFMALKKNFYK